MKARHAELGRGPRAGDTVEYVDGAGQDCSGAYET
jgi:hypothetical protein